MRTVQTQLVQRSTAEADTKTHATEQENIMYTDHDYTPEERQSQEAAYDAYMTARAEYEQRLMHVMCDLCDAEDYGPAKALEANGWELTSTAAFCWRHGGH